MTLFLTIDFHGIPRAIPRERQSRRRTPLAVSWCRVPASPFRRCRGRGTVLLTYCGQDAPSGGWSGLATFAVGHQDRKGPAAAGPHRSLVGHCRF